jgi:hypothetical protein
MVAQVICGATRRRGENAALHRRWSDTKVARLGFRTAHGLLAGILRGNKHQMRREKRMKRWILGGLMGLTVWGTAFPADAALVMSGAGTMRFQWVDLRDSGGSSLSALPSGLTAIGDAVAFGFAEGGAYSANYWKNGVLSNDVWVKVPLALGDLYESELSVSGELDFGPGFVNVYCLTWSTIYFHNETAESYSAEFSVDYAATLSAADPEEFTDFNMVASELYISDFINDPPYLGYRDAIWAIGTR